MFKKGQLVQSVKYGDLYAVPLVRVLLHRLFFTPERLRLIGNNYKPKLTDEK
jgi:hypothetical protein